MKIERVQYDGEGKWLDVRFGDGRGFRLPALNVRMLADDDYYHKAESDEDYIYALKEGIEERKP